MAIPVDLLLYRWPLASSFVLEALVHPESAECKAPQLASPANHTAGINSHYFRKRLPFDIAVGICCAKRSSSLGTKTLSTHSLTQQLQ